MTFTELLTEVLDWTKRPDLTTSAKSAIRRITLAAHRKEKFWRDLNKVVLGSLPSDTVQTVDITASLPRFRQLAYVKVTGQDIYLTPVDADDLLDNDGWAKTNIVFAAGTQLNIKAAAAQTSYDITYWQDPVVSPEGSFASWIADTQPDLIIAGAAKTVFAFDNESEIFKAAAIQEAEEWQELLRNNIELQGR